MNVVLAVMYGWGLLGVFIFGVTQKKATSEPNRRFPLLARLSERRSTPIALVAHATPVRITGTVVSAVPLVIDDGTGRAVVDLDPVQGDQAWLHCGRFRIGARVTVLGIATVEPDLTASDERGYRDQLPGKVLIFGSHRFPLGLTDDVDGVDART